MYRLLHEHDDRIATAFDDLRRSTALQRLGAMLIVGAVTEEELAEFSAPTRNAAITWAGIAGGHGSGPEAGP